MVTPLPSLCPMTDGDCSLREETSSQRLSYKPYCFIALPFSKEFDAVEATIKTVIEGGSVFKQKYEKKKVENKNLNAIVARDKKFIGQGMCKICQLCWFSDIGIVELATLNPNVMIETGWLMGFSKRIIFTLNKSFTPTDAIPFDLGNIMLVTYYNVIQLAQDLEDKIRYILLTWKK